MGGAGKAGLCLAKERCGAEWHTPCLDVMIMLPGPVGQMQGALRKVKGEVVMYALCIKLCSH